MIQEIKTFAAQVWGSANIPRRIILGLLAGTIVLNVAVGAYVDAGLSFCILWLYALALAYAGMVEAQQKAIAQLSEENRELWEFANLFDMVRAEPPTDG